MNRVGARPIGGIGFLLYPDCQISMAHGMTDLLRIANHYAVQRGDPPVAVSFWERGEAGAIAPKPVLGEGDHREPEIMLVPGRLSGPVTAEEALPYNLWLQNMHRRGTVLASSCLGAFLLAEAGLLEGRIVTTHWRFAEVFQERFPGARLQPDRIFIEDGDIITAGGVMAWTDLALRVIDRLLGPEVVQQTAHFSLLEPSGREQQHYSSFLPRLAHGDALILEVQQWLQLVDRLVPVAEMAAHAALEERTFLRRFKAATGIKPAEYQRQLQIGRARELLQSTTRSVDQVAWAVGYEDTSSFRRAFQKSVGLSPRDYRRRFSATLA